MVNSDYKPDMSSLQDGDNVYSIVNGPGVVMLMSDEKEHEHFISVLFGNGIEQHFNSTGRSSKHSVHRELYRGTKHPFTLLL